MKKWGAALVAAVLLIGVGVAVALGGSRPDPLISLSYLEGTYFPALREHLQERASKGTQDAYDGAVGRLDALGEADLEQAEGFDGEETAYQSLEIKAGDLVYLNVGGSLVVYEGKLSVAAGTLADVTDGTTAERGQSLAAGHRYIVTSPEGVSLSAEAAGRVGYAGVCTREEGALPFLDVSEGQWFYDAVRFVYRKGYFTGVAADQFSPNSSMTRAMLATVLYRVAESTDAAGESPFTDVTAGQWYTDGIAWASAKGVVNGMGDGTYHPNDPVTRQQMVTMLYRYAKGLPGTNMSARGDLDRFPDGAAVADWAREAMAWAIGAGVITGRDTGHLDPTGTASRAEVATVLRRFVGG